MKREVHVRNVRIPILLRKIQFLTLSFYTQLLVKEVKKGTATFSYGYIYPMYIYIGCNYVFHLCEE